VISGGREIAFAEIEAYPGSPKWPASPAQMDAKIADCLDVFRRRSGVGPSVAEFQADLEHRIGP
jgi:hypothetical protein